MEVLSQHGTIVTFLASNCIRRLSIFSSFNKALFSEPDLKWKMAKDCQAKHLQDQYSIVIEFQENCIILIILQNRRI